MKTITLVSLIFLVSWYNSVPELYPQMGRLINKSLNGETKFNQERQECNRVWSKVQNQSDLEDLSEEDKLKYQNCDETYESYWDISGIGCSWYCGGGQDTLSSTSTLESFNGISYAAQNAHDLSYKTAWIEGVDGYGIGEILKYHFPPESPRITKVIIVNGYIKSDKSWKENSRVKKLKLYLNSKPIAILNLLDNKHEQEFEFEPIGESARSNLEELRNKPWWTMEFEIMEVYKGDRYDDTAITEIYFDGIDVH